MPAMPRGRDISIPFLLQFTRAFRGSRFEQPFNTVKLSAQEKNEVERGGKQKDGTGGGGVEFLAVNELKSARRQTLRCRSIKARFFSVLLFLDYWPLAVVLVLEFLFYSYVFEGQGLSV